MDNKFSKRAKVVFVYSKDEAIRLHSKKIKPEHIMLAIIKCDNGHAVNILRNAGVDLANLKDLIESYLSDAASDNTQASSTPSITEIIDHDDNENGTIEVDRAADRTIKISQLEARLLRQTIIEPEHLILAILKDSSNYVQKILLQNYKINYRLFFDQYCKSSDALPKQNQSHSNASFSSHLQPDSDQDDETNDNAGKNNTNNGANAPKTAQNREGGTPILDNFGFDMTQAAIEGKLDPVVGRENEILRMSQILARRMKNNPVLIGEPGVGKSAVVEGLAQRIANNEICLSLCNKRVISLDLGRLIAGTKYRGQFEERIKGLLLELKENPDVIIFIDEIHNLIGAGNAQGAMDAANLLKPALSRGEFQCIGATTLSEYRTSIEEDGALERRFQKVLVEPTSKSDTLTILQNIKSRYEEHHNVTYTDKAILACINLTERYITNRNFPDKAIDALDEAGAHMHVVTSSIPESRKELEKEIRVVKSQKEEAIKLQKFEDAANFRDQQRKLENSLEEEKAAWAATLKNDIKCVTEDTVAEVVSVMSGIPVQKVAASESEKLLHLRQSLKDSVIGQDSAVEKTVKAILRNRVGLKDPRKPIGTFLFLGPTGVGKTYLAQKLADEMFAIKDSLIRIDMSEYMEKYSVSRLIGSPPGYVGHEKGGMLTEKVRRHPYSVILLDEIEKAHPDIFNLLLQVFDEGRLTDSLGRTVDFRNTIIILTSNVGSRQLKDFGTGIGFNITKPEEEKKRSFAVIQKALGNTFSPEFLNRIDDIISFDSLSRESIQKIIQIELKGFFNRVNSLGYQLELTDKALQFLADKGYDPLNGARPLKRAIQEYLENEMCEILLEAQLKPMGHKFIIDIPDKAEDGVELKPTIQIVADENESVTTDLVTEPQLKD